MNIRKTYVEELIKEVLGPRNGIRERLGSVYSSENPYYEYITGIIVPEGYVIEESDRGAETDVVSSEEGIEEDSTSESFSLSIDNLPHIVSPKMPPKSFGLSFTLSSEFEMDVCITWARYFWNDKEKFWVRRSFHSVVRGISTEKLGKSIVKRLYYGDDGVIELHIWRVAGTATDGNIPVVIKFVNKLKYEGKLSGEKRKIMLTSRCVFQPSIRVKLISGELKTMEWNATDDLFNFLYRKKSPKARGYLCSAIWRDIDYSPDILDVKVIWPDVEVDEECTEFIRPDVRSEFVPLFAIVNPDFDWKESKKPCFHPFKLSEIWNREDIDECLSPIIEAYEKWMKKNIEAGEKIKRENDRYSHIVDHIIAHQQIALERIREGINLLKEKTCVRLAFNFANRVIWLQNEWLKKYWGKQGDFTWRSFQLAFILLSLKPLYDDSSEYREYVDLLWVPTGGGKTEAYLAIMAYMMALRRLRSVSDESKYTGYGTAVITRYTLRLLTIQQFRRILRMVTAAEYLRTMKISDGSIGWRPEKSDVNGDYIYGRERFSIGMWVGSGVSPNSLYGKWGAIDILLEKPDASTDTDPRQVVKCPVCGAWLRIPDSGLPPGETHILHWRVKMENSESIKSSELKDILNDKTRGLKIEDVNLTYREDHAILTIHMRSEKRKIMKKTIERIWDNLKDLGIKPLSVNVNSPGYFALYHGDYPDTPVDFGMYCPNPECDLNHYDNKGDMEPCMKNNVLGFCERSVKPQFSTVKTKVIPAYTVDDQIYHRAPTVVISTVDKIARLAFEPRAAAIFGNVEYYNPLIGYFRKKHPDLLPKSSSFFKTGKRKKERVITSFPDYKTVEIENGFMPPEVIIQDELHLVTGPLGSMFGIYEGAAETIIEKCWVSKFHKHAKTKYIASTATIKEADHQTISLFARKLFIFPPHGLIMDDSFFIKYPKTLKEQWNSKVPGRVYMGIAAIGRGPHTPQIRIWSRLLHTGSNLKGEVSDEELKYYWTVVGYFNSIRELGGARSLYREDVVERLKRQLHSGRKLDPLKVHELSSRIRSTEIPIILENMETDIKNNLENMMDAIFTTSMFGTGVDIPHLSLMVVDGQPKTTSAYIQATGRVGRRKGALVVTFLNVAKPRDLSHYEMFPAYHQRLHLGVESPAVAPYSSGAIERGSGPAMVGVLRNICDACGDWYDNEKPWIIIHPKCEKDAEVAANILGGRLVNITEILGISTSRKLRKDINTKIDRWYTMAHEVPQDKFKFYEYSYLGSLKHPSHLVLGDLMHQDLEYKGVKVVYRNAPQSLRDTEKTTAFGV